MSAGKHNDVIERGATWKRTFFYKDPVENPIDLTGCVVKMQLRQDPKDSSPVIYEMSTEDEDGRLTITNASQGRIDVKIPAADTEAFEWTSVVYDIRITHPNGDRQFLIEGTLCIDDMVTQ